MTKATTAAAVILAAAMCGGCMTYRDMGKYNEAKRAQNAIKVEAMRGAAGGDALGAWVGVDLLEVGTGYAAWWSERPGEAALDTTIDLGTAALAALGTKVVYDWLQEDDVQEIPAEPTVEPVVLPPNFSVSGETVIVNIGTGNSVGSGATQNGGVE